MSWLAKIAMIPLAPWLIRQGNRARRDTVRLPEAKGERFNTVEASDLSVLILGDSAAAGVGCATQSDAITGQLVHQLQSRGTVRWRLIAQSSLTCAGVHELLLQHADEPFDVVLVSVGVNDVTRRTPIAQWRWDLEVLTNELVKRHQAKLVLFSAVPPMHRFTALPQPLRWFVGEQAHNLNRVLEQHCQDFETCEILKFDIPFHPRYLASDGYHPSGEACTLWAAAAASAILQSPKLQFTPSAAQ
ncbi:lipase [Pseudidiomarina aestuarii]|uniref:Lipase n=1 Tax=Pseudidiomarina aestuarii TaxID=624146 RepID=A0A7Z7ESJ9_9GAMM|nr:SGNH/GDSL hydrolase family protein [Pseudidiomarina aestuarii]RUO38968.1 lipase [Pseudidiomarina aestuarii]